MLIGCSQNTVPATLRSLQGSGDVSFVCVGKDGTGRDLTSCPDFENQGTRMLALVTQSIAGEVALIQLAGTGGATGVVDVDPSTPGYNFLRVGANPVHIVSTPDGVASFVGVAELDKPGIYALPTTCLGPPKELDAGADGGKRMQMARDLTSWPACELPSAPGEMAIVIDPPRPDGTVRMNCAGDAEKTPPPGASHECAADLTASSLSQRGRRKIVVTLPDVGQIAIVDAQSLLDRPPGSFDACPIDGLLPLEVNLPAAGINQALGDLGGSAGAGSQTCLDSHHDSPRGPFTARPSGLKVAGHHLYIGDQNAPVIHTVDLSDTCHPVELEPLLPVSLEHPERVVTTTRISVSPVTRAGQQFLYAIDEKDQPASVMVFDITTGASRTPLIRPGADRMPLEPPDRIAFTPAARDVAFALHDVPIPDATGNIVFGTECNPDPSIGTDTPGALYRPSESLATGAAPTKLRGVFGFVMLTDGHIAVIDLEDFDAPCRRPTLTNPSPNEDFRGCKNDPAGVASYTLKGVPTVTNEVSCRIVEPHRARAQDFALTNDNVGVRAPSLRGFPSLSSISGGLITDQSASGRKQPKLLPVDFPNPSSSGGTATLPAQVYIGSTLFSSDRSAVNRIDTDPSKAARSALVLPLNSPRAYPAPQENVTVTYEGALFKPRPSGLMRFGTENQLLDDNAGFCSSGVEDVALARETGRERFPSLSTAALDAFASAHADFVQIVQDFLPADDPYWTTGPGANCGGNKGRSVCVTTFGDADVQPLRSQRDFSIVSAWETHLDITPRDAPHTKPLTAIEKQSRMDLLSCCFPSAVQYTVRASSEWIVVSDAAGFRHRIKPDAQTGACVRDCNPRKRFYLGRAFEISSAPACGTDCSVGASDPSTDMVCNTYTKTKGPASPAGDLAPCIFDGLTERFAIYRGTQISQRDMSFAWQTIGGFRPLTLDLVSQSTSVSPQSIQFVPELNQLAVVDGESLGLTLMSLDTLGVVRPSPFY